MWSIIPLELVPNLRRANRNSTYLLGQCEEFSGAGWSGHANDKPIIQEAVGHVPERSALENMMDQRDRSLSSPRTIAPVAVLLTRCKTNPEKRRQAVQRADVPADLQTQSGNVIWTHYVVECIVQRCVWVAGLDCDHGLVRGVRGVILSLLLVDVEDQQVRMWEGRREGGESCTMVPCSEGERKRKGGLERCRQIVSEKSSRVLEIEPGFRSWRAGAGNRRQAGRQGRQWAGWSHGRNKLIQGVGSGSEVIGLEERACLRLYIRWIETHRSERGKHEKGQATVTSSHAWRKLACGRISGYWWVGGCVAGPFGGGGRVVV
ncbi:hypothetical protein BC629DRAFT_1435331 [Irpex lacteus]|nr:hypothetical protein BC629DRAFT_1435331 [Irpex lacteus]